MAGSLLCWLLNLPCFNAARISCPQSKVFSLLATGASPLFTLWICLLIVANSYYFILNLPINGLKKNHQQPSSSSHTAAKLAEEASSKHMEKRLRRAEGQ